jgi:hypothetical protein
MTNEATEKKWRKLARWVFLILVMLIILRQILAQTYTTFGEPKGLLEPFVVFFNHVI